MPIFFSIPLKNQKLSAKKVLANQNAPWLLLVTLFEKEYLYAYHLSDCKNHDASFAVSVTRDLLSKYPDYKDFPTVRIKSDNCSTQYCCLHVFRRYLDLAKEINKPVILYYGVNGHGRGLVDAMSGFGVKSPLRRKIVVEDFFFGSADELCIFLQETFQDDPRKIYILFQSTNWRRCVESRKV